MYERFTDRARRSVVLAQEEARSMRHLWTGTGHLLIGLAAEGSGVAARALAALGFTLDGARATLRAEDGDGARQEPAPNIPWSTYGKRVVGEYALRESLSLGHSFIGTEHLLLGLLREPDSSAGRILAAAGITPEAVRDEVTRLLAGYERQEAPAPERPADQPWHGTPGLGKVIGQMYWQDAALTPDEVEVLVRETMMLNQLLGEARALTAEPVTEYATPLKSGDMVVRCPDAAVERVYPLATWLEHHGAAARRRRIVVIEDWTEITEVPGG